MNEVVSYLDADWMIKSELREELLEIIEKDYENNYERFMKDVVMTEDFASTRWFVDELYYNDQLSNF